ncbi:MAG TPA: HEAT repeat domain-containing protein [Gemmatimonadaceae bacterium]|nr:HEAT repeat domain-containing protein [Gemmatimonadaceae bacterium]
MEPIPNFATEFAHLLWQLTKDPKAVEEQKATLRRVMLAREPEGVEIELGALNIAIVGARGPNGVPESVPWLSELTTRMAAHAVRAMYFDAQVPALEVLGVARALAAAPQLRDDGQAFDARIVALKLTAITIKIGREGFVRHATPRAGVGVIRATPAAGMRSVGSSGGSSIADRLKTPPTNPKTSRFDQDLRPAAHGDGDEEKTSGGVGDARFEIMSREIARLEPIRDLSALTKLLAEATDGDTATAAGAEALRAAEERIQHGDWIAAATILAALVGQDGERDPEVRRAYLIYVRRLLKPHALRGLAKLLPNRKEMRESLHAIFANSNEDGVDALVELMTAANTPGERRAYRDALAACPHAAPTLGHMLGDPQWFVVRNAAELLGEMGVTEVDGRLVETLSHPDTRVRRAATGALARIGTPRALHALQDMLRDANPDIRLQAALGLGAAGQRAASTDLITALDNEEDKDVQHALVTALGKVGTPEAIERLKKVAKRGSIFRRNPSGLRVAAVNALGEAATPEALEILNQLADDRDAEVRAAVERALRAKSAL